MIYVIACALAEPARQAPGIEEWLLANVRSLAEPLPLLWIAEGPIAAEALHTGLTPLLGDGDRLLIVKAATEAVWHGLDAGSARWLADNFPGSITERIPGASEGRAGG